MTPTLVSLPLEDLHRYLRGQRLPTPNGEPCETQTLVYALVDPDSDAVRYIGLSSTGIKRPMQHALPSNIAKDATAKAEWVLSLMRRGKSYRIAILTWGVKPSRLADTEDACIRFYRSRGARLLNKRGGGGGARRPGQSAYDRIYRRMMRESDNSDMMREVDKAVAVCLELGWNDSFGYVLDHGSISPSRRSAR